MLAIFWISGMKLNLAGSWAFTKWATGLQRDVDNTLTHTYTHIYIYIYAIYMQLIYSIDIPLYTYICIYIHASYCNCKWKVSVFSTGICCSATFEKMGTNLLLSRLVLSSVVLGKQVVESRMLTYIVDKHINIDIGINIQTYL
jgi:hypothetical protein